ncbi:hypothetical protein [Mesorhizobium sp. M8A.F.Ca.ET.182.01.1.1]|uniref:hypothetical protein n=1 Tax=Mesorhizobium sp. M8A.F.Ca.ET.182.01.1.1 TaxID=2563964 RepID=UPI0026822D89
MANNGTIQVMTKLEQIEKSITELSPEELKAFAAWFEALQADIWDRQIEADVKAGRLDKLVAEARAEIAAGKLRDL